MSSMVLKDLYYFHIPTKLVIGCGAASQVATEAKELSILHPLIVTDPGVRNAGIVDKVLGPLSEVGLSYSIFDGVEPNPKVSTVVNGVEVYQKEQCDGLISVGGGSPIDSAKAIGILATHTGSIMDYAGFGKVKSPIPPHIAVPTTYGTGTEVTNASMITDSDRSLKTGISSRFLFPNVAVIDPEMALSLPQSIGASTGMDALTHGIESYVSIKAQPITEGISLHAIRLVSENLTKAVAGDLEAISYMIIASAMTGFCFSYTRTAAVHGIAHTLGGHFDVPHGIANAILLPHVMEFSLEACPEKYMEVAKAMGEKIEGLSPKEAAQRSVEFVNRLLRDLGLPTRLRDIGCDKKKFPQVVEDTMKTGNILVNPRRVTGDDVLELLTRAY